MALGIELKISEGGRGGEGKDLKFWCPIYLNF